MNFSISGKVAFVTGAAGGIGSATARLFVSQGVAVALFDLDGEGAERLAAELREQGGRAIGGALDVRELTPFEAAVARTEQELGSLDFMVSVAGGGSRQSMATMSLDDWHRIVDLNLTGPFNAIKSATPALRRRGSGAIVTVGSLAGLRMSMNNGVSYTASKAGVLGLTRHAAYELGRDNIRVNALCPGPVNTPLLQELFAKDHERAQRRLVHIPIGRFAKAEELAAAVAFLASDDAGFITASTFLVDGGISGAYVTPL